MNNNFNIGERVRELRVREGLSQENLALRSEITTSYLGLIERNIKNPTIKIIEQICNALSISLSDFFNVDSAPYLSIDTISLQVLSQISNRSAEEKQLLLNLIKTTLKLRDLEN